MSAPHSHLPIGVLLHSDVAYANPLLRGLERAARIHNTRYVIYGTSWADMLDHYGAQGNPAACLGHEAERVSGTILCFGGQSLVSQIGALHARGHPCVLAIRSHGNVPCVLPDDERCIAALIERLHRQGHRRIAFLGGHPNNGSAVRRLQGYRAGLAKAGLPWMPDLVLGQGPDDGAARHAMRLAIDQRTDFTALICFNDTCALAALAEFKARGIRVPDDVEVVGFDDVPSAALADPPLSTFRFHMEEIAFAAMEKMVRLLRGDVIEATTRIPLTFVARRSTRFADPHEDLDHAAPPAKPPPEDPALRRLVNDVPLDAPLPVVIDAIRTASLECIRLRLDLDDFAAHLVARPAPVPSSERPSADTLRATVDLMRGVARLARDQAVERAKLLHFLTTRLRHTSFEALDEALVLDVLRESLAALGFERVGLHLRPNIGAGGTPGAEGVFRTWNLATGEERTESFDEKDLAARIESIARTQTTTFATALFNAGSLVGHIITDGDHERCEDLAEIIRYLVSSLHGIRIYQQLADGHDELRRTQRELVEMSRRAGIAEMATGVLHNVGNALNSVNTSVGLVENRLGTLRFDALGKLERLLLRTDEPWGDVFASGERGGKVIEFLRSLGSHLDEERVKIRGEVELLRSGVEHINDIVAAQQQFAQVAGVIEDFDPAEVPEYALRLCEAELGRHGIAVVRDYHPAPSVRLERHKVVQILVNLIRNAKDALGASEPEGGKKIALGLRPAPEGMVRWTVSDNGAGIAPEHTAKMFTMGFTTKKDGHGFGLHNCALIASSLGGSLTARSEGAGLGATFVLTLPAKPDPGGGD